ncbi:SusD family protein [Pedobacter westerhofensis]|uniref:SusD family protein n=1 Tax=Pedobacter westerhofensis TaxID=425512 RepID=A0A521CQH8_9SPHI|nr:RagB/SusD family nutrient uptake outer membrane protein [Pedobacter westerhofensis]SMO61724.1 SusD family protein [Pedobacter westerhofensis]
MKNLLLSEYLLILFVFVLFFITGCGKYLEAVPDKSLTVPNSVADYQALLENEMMFINSPALGEFGSDDLYLPDALWETQENYVRDAYHWSKDLNEGVASLTWNNPYKKIYYANTVLEGVEQLRNSHSSAEIDILKGWALFCRANSFYDLQELFGQPYRPASAARDLGIPLRLNTNLEEKTGRATVAETFGQILTDLDHALPLLSPNMLRTNRNRPSKAAVYALMARVYLIRQNYEKALECAEQCLQQYGILVDYNSLNPNSNAPFSPLIDEIIYNGIQLNYGDRYWQVEYAFYQSYSTGDLRKNLFFTEDPLAKSVVFKGFYSATATAFNGLSTDEVYLIKAECESRLGRDENALTTLNTVLTKRWKAGTYLPFTIAKVPDVLTLILTERRKECLFRNLRWSDLRRLNQDPRFAKTLSRTIQGIVYQIPPNDPRYVLPIPDNEIRLNGITQNMR